MEKKREITPSQAFDRMARYCSTAERCESDVIRLTRGYGLNESSIATILARLRELNFISDKRYLTAFVRSKERSGWGRYKISAALRAKGFSSSAISAALELLSSGDDTLLELLSKKMRTVKYKDRYDLHNKLMRYALSRGFDVDMAKGAVEKIECSEELANLIG